MADITAIKERLEKATAGEWKAVLLKNWGSAGTYTQVIQDSGGCTRVVLESENAGDNADFIAHARQDIPYLLDEIERLRGLLAKHDGHTADCASRLHKYSKMNSGRMEIDGYQECDCNWQAIAKGLGL